MLLFNKIANVLLALVILFATTGITFNKHYCMGKLKNVAIYQKAESCMTKMEMQGEACSKSCCQDVTEEFKVDELHKLDVKPNLETNYNLLAVISYVLIDYNLISTYVRHLKFGDYSPPLISQDVTVLIQSFLI